MKLLIFCADFLSFVQIDPLCPLKSVGALILSPFGAAVWTRAGVFSANCADVQERKREGQSVSLVGPGLLIIGSFI
jgi:hypothetical protein